MISTTAIRIWTPYGYLFADDLYIGEKVISFNPERGVCEYDKIHAVDIEYTRCMGYGINSKSMNQLLTPDHPVLVYNNKTRKLNKVPIGDKFMTSMSSSRNTAILSHALFEPYVQTHEPDDIKWSARIAATLANYRCNKVNLDHVVKDLGGYEAQLWLDTFFHWNFMIPAVNWMATIRLKNMEVRDIVFDIASRAGVGAKWYKLRNNFVVSITTNGYVYPMSNNGWFKKAIDGLTFNVTTKNGNVLVKSSNGTFLVACNKMGG